MLGQPGFLQSFAAAGSLPTGTKDVVITANTADGLPRGWCQPLDDTTALVETGITSEDYTPSMTVAAAGTAEGLPLDIPLLADANDSPGYYAAVKTSDESSVGLINYGFAFVPDWDYSRRLGR